jgi:hypothetical protein
LEAQPGGVAVLRFTVAGLYAIPHIIDPRQGGPWKVLEDQIPELNTYLKGPLVVVVRGSPESVRGHGLTNRHLPAITGALPLYPLRGNDTTAGHAK